MKTRKQVFGYLRVSSPGQVEGDGFERQQTAIEGHCRANGIEVVSWFKEEGISGTKGTEDRPAFQTMLAEILKNGVKTVVVEGLDRLAREFRIQETLLIYMASKGIEVIVARTGENVTQAIEADPMRKALVQIQGVFAELEKSLLVEKLRAARERKRAKQGKCEGRKRLDEIAPETVREIKRLRRKRKGGIRLSLERAAEILNQNGHRTASGKPFTPASLALISHRLSRSV